MTKVASELQDHTKKKQFGPHCFYILVPFMGLVCQTIFSTANLAFFFRGYAELFLSNQNSKTIFLQFQKCNLILICPLPFHCSSIQFLILSMVNIISCPLDLRHGLKNISYISLLQYQLIKNQYHTHLLLLQCPPLNSGHSDLMGL